MNRLRESPLPLREKTPHAKAEPVLIIRFACWNCGNAGVGNFSSVDEENSFTFAGATVVIIIPS